MTAWAIVSDLRASKRLSDLAAARYGPESYGGDTSVVDRIAAIVPPRSRYVLLLSGRIDGQRALAFRLWSLPALLPRVAVRDAATAGWIVAWG